MAGAKKKVKKQSPKVIDWLAMDLRDIFGTAKEDVDSDSFSAALKELSAIYSKKEIFMTTSLKTVQFLSILEEMKITKPSARQKLYMAETSEFEEFSYTDYAQLYIFASKKAVEEFIRSGKIYKYITEPEVRYAYDPFRAVLADLKKIEDYFPAIECKI